MSKHILVVDDEEVIRNVFQTVLEQEGYKADTVGSGEEAVKAAKKRRYDLVFLDLNLPGINGIETLKKLREMDETICVYIVTGFQDIFIENLRMLSRKGVDFEILAKPVSTQQIVAVAKGALEGAHSVGDQ